MKGMNQFVRMQLSNLGVETDPSKLHRIHSLSAPSARGKDTVMEALLTMAGRRVQVIKRFTTRELRPGDHYIRTTLDQLQKWEANDELLGGKIFSPYEGVNFGTPLFSLHQQLMDGPIVCHNLPPAAAIMKANGYRLELSRLVATNRGPEQIPARAQQRLEQDTEFERQMEEYGELFNCPDIINDFALSKPSGFMDAGGNDIPMGGGPRRLPMARLHRRMRGMGPLLSCTVQS